MNIIEQLGIDPEDLSWTDLALCAKKDPSLFFEQYETKVQVAKNVDEMCLSCPIMKECGLQGATNNEYGVWGGIYWNGSGKKDESRNSHKTPENWDNIKKRYAE